mgnify:CR=1 FL=1
MQLTITDTPLSPRPFLGLGVQADGVLYNALNAECGCGVADYALNEERLLAMRPAIARMFFDVDAICPGLRVDAFDPQAPAYANNLRMLRVLKDCGTRVNAVLFKPFEIPLAQLDAAVDCMVHILRVLRDEDDCDHIRWLTLYNEPESPFPHDSPLMRRVFGAERLSKWHTWEDYVRLNHGAIARIAAAGLDVQLAVADCVWGAQVRRERMERAAAEFHSAPVCYSYHNYNPESREFYAGGNPDYAYAGMREEAAHFRALVGPEAPLVTWEFNLAGTGFGSHFPGVDERGSLALEAPDGGARIADKVLRAIQGGVDGLSIWCMGDMHYMPTPQHHGVMRFGLWRYKWENWTIRPYAHAYALLCQTLRPGIVFRAVEGGTATVHAVAGAGPGGRVVAIVNTGDAPADVTLAMTGGWPAGTARTAAPQATWVKDMAFPQATADSVDAAAALRLGIPAHAVTVWTSQ